MSNKSKQWGAIIIMIALFAMIAFVTNLCSPMAVIVKNQFGASNFQAQIGNYGNFIAYLLMGIPSGMLIKKYGYKATALMALVLGILGVFVQWMSGWESMADSAFSIYLIGAFIAGFCMCMLNTVVNPMLNILGGGGNKGNQLIQTGGALNSLSGTLTPFFVGALIGQLTSKTQMGDVAPLLWIAMGIFAASFVIISFVKIPEPNMGSKNGKAVKFTHSPWNFRHTVLGVIAIFFYVGIEIGIPGTLNFYLADQKATGAGVLGDASTIAGAVVALYWLLMLVGRSTSSVISGKVSTRAQLVTVTSVCMVLIFFAIITPKESRINVPSILYDPVESVSGTLTSAGMPQGEIDAFIANPSEDKLAAYTEQTPVMVNDAQGNETTMQRTVIRNSEKQPHEIVNSVANVPGVPISALFLILCGLCTSVMWGGIFNLAVEGLGKYTAQASGIFMMMVVGGGVIPLIQQLIAKSQGYMVSYYLIIAAVAYIFFYAVWGCINVNKDIPVDIEEEMKEELV